jgi:predicted O-methyltransferase YrrM
LFHLATVNDHLISLKRLLDEAENYVASYLERTAGLSHATRGIRRSEMFFLYAAIAHLEPKRILESGRARAQSTLVLSSLFPRATIVSIESEANSPDVAVAAARLESRTNIKCLFGDSRLLMPQLLHEDDIILIDGPKDFRALKLALRLLRTGKPRAVFVPSRDQMGDTSRSGPFVMNTRSEIIEAVEDYQAGRLGIIPADQLAPRSFA